MALRSLLLDLALPPACSGCGSEGELLCRRCTREMTRRCAMPPGTPIGLPGMLPLPLVQLEWCARFSGATRRALHDLKYAGERRLAGPLSDALAARWREASRGGDLLVGVPVHASRLKQRGYDQARLLASALSPRIGVPYAGALERSRMTAPQFELGRAARRTNVTGAFCVTHGMEGAVAGRWVVLIDDVVTTGATLSACASALYDAGAIAVSAFTVARER